MFNRTRQSGDPKAQSAAASAFDDVLAELEATGTPESDPADSVESAEPAGITESAEAPAPADAALSSEGPGAGSASPEPAATPRISADAIAEHAATLRATRDAQQQAQKLLEMASKTRNDATEEAEQIVLEARDVAERVTGEAAFAAEHSRNEAIQWVKAQRARVEAASASLAQEAERDAEQIRAEAMRSAMVEAEQTARLYVGEAAARGARDAEEIRRQAREVMHRATVLAAGIQASIDDMLSAVDVARSDVRDQLAAIATLLEYTRGGMTVPAAQSAGPVPGVGTEPETQRRVATAVAESPESPESPESTEAIKAERKSSVEGGSLGAMFRTADSPEA